jgi:chemosensory pili system protein ChpA (sensor histidine kinase/response regulator)
MIDHLKKKILFADDSSSSLMYLSLLLKRMGFHVVSVKNGLDALKQLEAIVPDLILLDINMPDLDGTEVLINLKTNEQTRDIPVVMISSDANQESIEKCEALGCAGYLVKPIQVDKLYASIETCIVFSSERKNRRHFRVPFNKKYALNS